MVPLRALLGSNAVEASLCRRSMTTRGETIYVHLSCEQAEPRTACTLRVHTRQSHALRVHCVCTACALHVPAHVHVHVHAHVHAHVHVHLWCEQAALARDALAKAVYTRLFDWLVDGVNRSTRGHATAEDRYIGHLLRTTHYSLLTTHYALRTTHYALCSLLTTHYSLLTTH